MPNNTTLSGTLDLLELIEGARSRTYPTSGAVNPGVARVDSQQTIDRKELFSSINNGMKAWKEVNIFYKLEKLKDVGVISDSELKSIKIKMLGI